jgi:hypothetical protein
MVRKQPHYYLATGHNISSTKPAQAEVIALMAEYLPKEAWINNAGLCAWLTPSLFRPTYKQ